MSSLFSIGEDELDLDDEDCLLAACGEGDSINCITDNSKKSFGAEQNQSISKTQLLRTKDMENSNSHNSRRPFESLSNINTSDRVSEKKRPSIEQVHRSSSFTNTTVWQRNNTTSTANGFHTPLAKRFAADNMPSPKPVSGNGASLFRSSSTPAFKNTDNTCTMSTYLSNKIYSHSTSSNLRNVSTRDSPSQNFRSPNLQDPSKRMEPHGKMSTPSNIPANNGISGLRTPNTCTGFKTLHNSNASDSNMTSPDWQQRGSFRSSPAVYNQMRDLPLRISNASSSMSKQNERPSPNSIFDKNSNGARTPETPMIFRQNTSMGTRTPQANQAVTPLVNRIHARTPSGSKTPTSRKFPGPAGLLPKLSPGQSLDDTSLVYPLPSMRKRSPVENKAQSVSQSSTSEDEDFNRDPWTFMHQDFLKNVPLAKRYTIIRVYSEAIQQRLDHGKVPCLCALVKAFSLTEADASVLLKDPTGEIHGTLHRKVLEDFQTELAPGAGLILKHVSVFSPAPRKHYLNITPGNILQIYPPDPQYVSSSQALASQCTQAGNKREEQRIVIEDEAVTEQAECNKETNITDETTPITEREEELIQEDCFEDLLEGLDDDEDLIDEALLV